MQGRCAGAVRTWLLPCVFFLASPAVAASAPEQGKLVHVADTRALHGFNLFIANLYNTDRLLFSLTSLAITAALGLALGVLMDLLVSSIGLDLRRREFKE